jgi:hypothetical protein
MRTEEGRGGPRSGVRYLPIAEHGLIGELDAITSELVSDSLVYRYHADESPDGLAGGEAGAAGLREDAHLCQTRRALLGGGRAHRRAARNFPQAFTRLALISAAYNLDRRLG